MTELSNAHYYIINSVTNTALAVNTYLSADEGGGMTSGTRINQYTTFGKKDKYNESFKFSFTPLGGTKYEITSKRTGMSMCVYKDSKHEGALIVQSFGRHDLDRLGHSYGWSHNTLSKSLPGNLFGSTNWHITEEDGEYMLYNHVTGGYLAVTSDAPHDDHYTVQYDLQPNEHNTPRGKRAKWHLVPASIYEQSQNNTTAAYAPEKDLRDNDWFIMLVPQPSDAPYGGATLAARLGVIGKMTGLFPDQDKMQVLFKALVKAMKQIVTQGFIIDNINDAQGIINAARNGLLEDLDSLDDKTAYDILHEIKVKYDDAIGQLMVGANAKGGLCVFMQAASEQLGIIRSMGMFGDKHEFAKNTWAATATLYHKHLDVTYKAMLGDRLKLIHDVDLTFVNMMGGQHHVHSIDTYQPSRHNEKSMYVNGASHGRVLQAWRKQQMTTQLNIELGDVDAQLAFWKESIAHIKTW
jgi:hypothetical protein